MHLLHNHDLRGVT